MGKMKDLAREMKALEGMVSVCTRCGTCQAHCPLYAQTRKEGDVSRGKIALLTGLAEEMFKNPKGVDERLNRCLLCGSCAKACPSGVDTQAIFIKARSILTQYLGLSFAKKMVFRRYLSQPQKFDRFMARMARFQSLALSPEENTQATSCGRVDIRLLRDRHLTPLAEESFGRQVKSMDGRDHDSNPVAGNGPRVSFFTGCLIDKARPQVGMAVVQVLEHFGCRVI
ncbi:MAG: (Fe-S)-binding protein, partial [Desulfobacterales bacterium]|nr:(Fe-S)-binding protein [Desulfobacterales bacterium]